MDVLSIVHGPNVGAEVFADAVRERGHRLVDWVPSTMPAPRLDGIGAVMVFGGAMHVDQHSTHPWLAAEDALLRDALEAGTPTLGICLGAQLLAKAADAWVGPTDEPEIGWFPVEVNDEGAADPVFGRLPRRFDAFQWHYYVFDVPAAGRELACNSTCSQAFRIGERAWGVQFHPEVTLEQVRSWIADQEDVPVDWAELDRETQRRMGDWNTLGRTLCSAFVELAERAA